jgi:SOS-response transcriptional repressor LexA
MNLSPTPAQKKLYDYLVEYFDEHGVYPSCREMCRAMGWKSVSSAHAMLHRLERRKMVKIYPYLERGLEIVR